MKLRHSDYKVIDNIILQNVRELKNSDKQIMENLVSQKGLLKW